MSKLLAHLLTAAALLLAAAVPAAWADTGTAPGALKKDASSTDTTAPAPAPAPTHTSAPSHSSPHATVPITKGTVKKVSTTAPTTTSAPTVVRRKRASSTAVASHHTGHSATRSGHTSSRRRAGGAAASSTRDVRARGAQAAPAAVHQPAPGSAGSRRSHAAARSAAQKHSATGQTTGFASLNRAADRVIQVIPGVLLLALASLVALVLVLIVRSWLMERRRGRSLEESYGITVQALATAIEAKDHTTGGHIERVRELGLLLAREMAPRDARDPQMAYGFLLHDIGKLAVPDAILRAPGRLSEEEWALMRRHPDEGARMLSPIPFLDRALDVVRHHHERWDGAGYPDGLAGKEIPLWARIFAVADALDAMTAERPYRARQPYQQALEEIGRNAGSQFDPAVVGTLERLDRVEVERLLEPAQVLDREPLAELSAFEPLAI